ncbi:MAG: phytanoyl-CoA dioxygenase family protein [Pseudomonadota bacterium]
MAQQKADLQVLPVTSPTQDILEVMERDGAAILSDVIDPDTIERVVAEVRPWIDATPMGRDNFAGKLTKRTGALVARTEACRELVVNQNIVRTAQAFLGPYTDSILLHLTQTIEIYPGSRAQSFHRDRQAWGDYLPASLEPQFNTIWALSPFTAENGATRCVPGSHRWEHDRRAEPHEITHAEMAPGSVFLYSGSVVHSGGENRSDAARLGLNITYTLNWLRTEENQYLSCPPEIAKDLDPHLQELLGYTQGAYAMGYYSDPQGRPDFSDIIPPEFALGRRPRKHKGLPSELAKPV